MTMPPNEIEGVTLLSSSHKLWHPQNWENDMILRSDYRALGLIGRFCWLLMQLMDHVPPSGYPAQLLILWDSYIGSIRSLWTAHGDAAEAEIALLLQNLEIMAGTAWDHENDFNPWLAWRLRRERAARNDAPQPASDDAQDGDGQG